MCVCVCVCQARDNGGVQDRQTLDHRRRCVAAVEAEDEGGRAAEEKTQRRSLKFNGTGGR